ncbi:MAG: hypothetical protein ACRD04_06565 [Terriglobales bacterium]
MNALYLIVLLACSFAVLALVGWRLLHLHVNGAPSRDRRINEWIWTLVPILILGALLWRALVAK